MTIRGAPGDKLPATEALAAKQMSGSSPPKWRVKVGKDETSAVFEPALAPSNGVLFVCAHGAGGHMADRGVLAVSEQLRNHGFDVVRFNFLYRDMGSGRP